MNTTVKNVLAILLLCFIPSSSFSSGNEGQNENSRFINVTIEIHGLEESAEYLKRASISLAEGMEELKTQKGNLTSEDLQRIERISDNMKIMTDKIDKTLLSIGPTIQNAKEPTVELLSAVIEDTKVQAIDPVVASVQSKVSESVKEIKWSLVTVGVVFLVAITVLGLFLFKIFKEMNGIATTIHNAFERGEFIFRPRDENA